MNGKEFLGRGLKFPLQVDPRTGKFAMVSHEDDIREAIGIILMKLKNQSKRKIHKRRPSKLKTLFH